MNVLALESPSPSPVVDPSLVTPGPLTALSFLLIAAGVIAVIVIVIRASVRAGRRNYTQAGWLVDPNQPDRYRWYDGQRWTDRYSDDPPA